MKLRFLLPLLLLALLTLALPAAAQSTRFGTTTLDITSGASVTNGTSAVTSNTAYTLTPGQGLSVLAMWAAAGTGTSNTVVNLQVSPDGTNYTTSTQYTLTAANNGTTAVAAFTNWTAAQLYGIVKIRFSGITTTQTNGVTVSKIQLGYVK